MNRRTWLALAATVFVLPRSLVHASENEHVPYSRVEFQRAMASGDSLLLDVYAPW